MRFASSRPDLRHDGYEEAAALGIVAGANAALSALIGTCPLRIGGASSLGGTRAISACWWMIW